MKPNLCQLKHLSCFGCCGHDWKTKTQILEQIKKNTLNWKNNNINKFAKDSEKHLSRSGICKSLILKNNKIVCALHPLQNNDEDFRDKNCNKNYFCKTYKEFLKWNKSTQKKFISFLLKKNISHYEYSIGLDSNLFLEEFKKLNSA